MGTKFENLILNALALEFVVSIDNLLFMMYFPVSIRDQLEHLRVAPPGDPPVDKKIVNRQWGADITDADITEQIACSISAATEWPPGQHGVKYQKSDVASYVRSIGYLAA